jgi:hypothetical protein
MILFLSLRGGYMFKKKDDKEVDNELRCKICERELIQDGKTVNSTGECRICRLEHAMEDVIRERLEAMRSYLPLRKY